MIGFVSWVSGLAVVAGAVCAALSCVVTTGAECGG